MLTCEIKENDKERITKILIKLAENYPEAKTGLVYKDNFQLFVATVLSAQTTDLQVNKITGKLFAAVPDIYTLSRMKASELEPYIRNCGLYHQKSRSLVQAARIIVNDYDGSIPDTLEELIKLPGVGRKTANIIISSVYGKPAIAVDTHVFRVSKRLNLADGKNVDVVEKQLKKVVPVEEWVNTHHRLIAHGRKICFARNPLCSDCFLKCLCIYSSERS